MNILLKITPWFILISSVFSEDIFQEKVYIRGQAMLASDVLQEAERQLDIRLVNKEKDTFLYRKDYDDTVSFAKLLEAVQAYYQKYNGITLLLKTPGKGRYVLVGDKSQVTTEAKGAVVNQVVFEERGVDVVSGMADSRGVIGADLLSALDESEESIVEPDSILITEIEDGAVEEPLVLEAPVPADKTELPAVTPVVSASGVEKGVIVDRPVVEMEWLNFPRLQLPDLYTAVAMVHRRREKGSEQPSGQSLNVEVLGLYRNAPQLKKVGDQSKQVAFSLDSSVDESLSHDDESLFSIGQLKPQWLRDLSWRWLSDKPSLTPLMVSTLGFSDGIGPEGLSGSLFYQRQHGNEGTESVKIDQLLFTGSWNHDFVDQGWACSISSGLVLGRSQFLGAKDAESRIAIRDIEFAARLPLDFGEDEVVMSWGPRLKIPSFDNELVNSRSVEGAVDFVSTFPWQSYIVSSNWSLLSRADSALLGDAKPFSITSSLVVGRELSAGYLELGYYYSSDVYASRFGGSHHFFKMSFKDFSSLPVELTLYLGANAATDGMDLALIPQSL